MGQRRPNLESYNQRQRHRNQPPNSNYNPPGQLHRNYSQHLDKNTQGNKEAHAATLSNYSSIPKTSPPNPQTQLQQPNSKKTPQTAGNPTQQMASILNQQQMLQNLAQPMMLNQMPFQMLAHQTPFHMLSHQFPVQMMSQSQNQMLINPTLNPDFIQQLLNNPEVLSQKISNTEKTPLPNPNLNGSDVPGVNILETRDFPALSPRNYNY